MFAVFSAYDKSSRAVIFLYKNISEVIAFEDYKMVAVLAEDLSTHSLFHSGDFIHHFKFQPRFLSWVLYHIFSNLLRTSTRLSHSYYDFTWPYSLLLLRLSPTQCTASLHSDLNLEVNHDCILSYPSRRISNQLCFFYSFFTFFPIFTIFLSIPHVQKD